MNKFYITSILLISICFGLSAFPNCNIYEKDDPCYNACRIAEEAVEAYPGSVEFQKGLLESIEMCPSFAFAHFELSVPYAKMGLMHEWFQIMNRAVELNPEEHLGWRGWYHWSFLHNYQKAIEDIEALDRLVTYDIGQTGDGNYHLNIIKGLCYKGLGQTKKAIEVIESTIDDPNYIRDGYVMLHLGVLYLELKNYSKALELFQNQDDYNPISEVHYYSAICLKLLGNHDKANEELNKALIKYDNRMTMIDSYRQLPDEINRSDITNLIDQYSK